MSQRTSSWCWCSCSSGRFFAAAEIALVTLRPGQVRELADRGTHGRRVARLREGPDRGDLRRVLLQLRRRDHRGAVRARARRLGSPAGVRVDRRAGGDHRPGRRTCRWSSASRPQTSRAAEARGGVAGQRRRARVGCAATAPALLRDHWNHQAPERSSTSGWCRCRRNACGCRPSRARTASGFARSSTRRAGISAPGSASDPTARDHCCPHDCTPTCLRPSGAEYVSLQR
jgi:hypothetical protein